MATNGDIQDRAEQIVLAKRKFMTALGRSMDASAMHGEGTRQHTKARAKVQATGNALTMACQAMRDLLEARHV